VVVSVRNELTTAATVVPAAAVVETMARHERKVAPEQPTKVTQAAKADGPPAQLRARAAAAVHQLSAQTQPA
jgi:hypothetical protein